MGGFKKWLEENMAQQEATPATPYEPALGDWTEIRLFVSSTFQDTHGERDLLVKNVIPEVNRILAPQFIRINPVDLRWGALSDETDSFASIQKTCLNQIDNSRLVAEQRPWFLGLRTLRYGWVQEDLVPAEDFERTAYFDWIDRLREAAMTVSITSLETCHAINSQPKESPYPTVFVYERSFSEETRQKLLNWGIWWLFDFDFIASKEEYAQYPESQIQYRCTEKADSYRRDRDDMTSYLAAQKNVIYERYHPKNGTAIITKKSASGRKSGIGKVEGLEEFGERVKNDLLTAIRMNFLASGSSDLDKFELERLSHENAMKAKAATFVGRTAMLQTAVEFLDNTGSPNTLIVHGEPGCGKSGLVAAITAQALNRRDNKDFVFVHAVDCCPGSSFLDNLLRRLNVELRKWRRSQGESRIGTDPPSALSDLKSEHHEMIREAAEGNPECQVIIIVDAVNQFTHAVRAWQMWWLMGKDCPPNVRFIISTLNTENGTFAYAQEACPDAHLLEVTEMDQSELAEMVRATLAKYNKKLCEDASDPVFGDQMAALISKNTSPLYLKAASEALRKYGRFDEITNQIKKFPDTIPELFASLVDEWSSDYGELFTRDVCCFIAVSKDGLLENQINDILHFKEEKVMGEDGGLLYDASFARIYDSISCFLAAGGGGYLRFFHDQLKYTVDRKLLSPEQRIESNQWLVDFFMSVISPRLCDGYDMADPPVVSVYYAHCLDQVVTHQLNIIEERVKSTGEVDTSALRSTLRNVFFVRERILSGQEDLLNEEFIRASEVAAEIGATEEGEAMEQWEKFCQMYTRYIRDNPSFVHSAAMNQPPSSVVHTDTSELSSSVSSPAYPLRWTNIPVAQDPMIAKYEGGGVKCTASTKEGDVVAVATGSSVNIFDQSSGRVLHTFDCRGMSVLLNPDETLLYVGDAGGTVHCVDLETGQPLYESSSTLDGPVVYLGWNAEGMVLAGTGYERKAICWNDHSKDGEVGLFEPGDLSQIQRWEVEDPAYDYCFNTSTGLLFSTHKGTVRGWDMDGRRVIREEDGSGCIYSCDSHPTKPQIITGNNDDTVYEWYVSGSSMEKRRSFKLPFVSGWAFGGVWACVYNPTGDLIYATEPQSQSIMVYNEQNEQIGRLKGHSECVNAIATVPGSDYSLISCDRGEFTIRWRTDMATLTASKEVMIEKLQWIGFSADEELFATVSDTHVRMWRSASRQAIHSKEQPGLFYRSSGEFHPDEKHLFASTRNGMVVLTVDGLVEVASHPSILCDDGSVSDIKISPDGKYLILVECRNMNSEQSLGYIWDVSDPSSPHQLRTIDGYNARMFSCAMAEDSQRAVIGGHAGAWIVDLATGSKLLSFSQGCMYVGWVPSTNDIVLDHEGKTVRNSAEDGSYQFSYSPNSRSQIEESGTFSEDFYISACSDGSVRVYNKDTGDCLYTFYDHRAQEFVCIARSKSSGMIAAGNKNGMLYILDPTNSI